MAAEGDSEQPTRYGNLAARRLVALIDARVISSSPTTVGRTSRLGR